MVTIFGAPGRREYYRVLRQDGKLHGTIKNAMAVWHDRQKRQQSTEKPDTLCRIEPGPELRCEAMQAGRIKRPRVRNWTHRVLASTDLRQTWFQVETHDLGKYGGNYSRYTHYEYSPSVRCCGTVVGSLAVVWIHDKRYRIRAPKGWTFGRDGYGLYIVRTRYVDRTHYRYHPHSDQWQLGGNAVRREALQHERKQIELERADRELKKFNRQAEQAMREMADANIEVYVCAKDSLRAGNCWAGTRSWAKQHQIDTRAHIPASVLRRLADGDRQVERAIKAAGERTVREWIQGFSVLADHRN